MPLLSQVRTQYDVRQMTPLRNTNMNITHIRNATQRIDYAGKRFLIDPMLADKGAWPGFLALRAASCAIRWSSYRFPAIKLSMLMR